MAQELREVEDFDSAYSESYPVTSIDVDRKEYFEPKTSNKPKKLLHLTKFQQVWLVICGIISFVMLINAFTVMMSTNEQKRSMNFIEEQIQSYQMQSEELKSQIAIQFNYEAIKTAAQENDMTVNKERIGSLSR